MAIRRLHADEFDVYRDIRLRALRSDPDAFGSTFEREARFDDQVWRERLTGFAGRPGVVFVSEPDGAVDRGVDGMVGVGRSEIAGDAVLWGMWVEPRRRGRGVADALVSTARDWAHDDGLDGIALLVRHANRSAIAFYERCGFDEAPDWPGDRPLGCAEERCMRMSIYAASP